MSPKIHPHPESQHVTLFGNRVIADVISLDKVTLDSGGSLIKHYWCPNQSNAMWRDRNTKRTTCEDSELGSIYKPTSARDCQQTTTGNYEEAKKDSTQSQGKHGSADTLILDFWLLEL